MSTLSRNKRRILNDLKDRETRQIFYSEHISAAIPIQIRQLRKKREYTQRKLGELAEMDQSTVSDLENPNYEYAPQIGTLERLANAFDVPLIVRFGSWEELWDWENNLTPERLAPKKFDEVLPKLEASVAQSEAVAAREARRRAFGLISGNGQTTPGRAQLEGLGNRPRNQSLARDEGVSEEPEGGLWAAAAGGRSR